MKGLLIKDFNLMKMQTRFWMILIAISLIMAFTDPSFLLVYLTIIIPLFALTTISYDEFDNGNAFLFTLPISRREYVIEKYLFALILGALSLVFGMVLLVIIGALNEGVVQKEIFRFIPIVFAVMTVAVSIMLPLQLKFGAEKGRIAVLIIFGGVLGISFAISKLFPTFSEKITNLLIRLGNADTAIFICSALLIIFAMAALSVVVSIKIMEKKEF